MTVNYSANPGNAPTSQLLTILQQAVGEWNLLFCQTGIFFVPTGGGFADLDFWRTSLDEQANGCIIHEPSSHDIVYGPAFEARLNSLGQTQARAAVIHEMGHFLGLGHTNPPLSPTIMTQATSCSAPVAVTSPSTADAQTAAGCMNNQPTCNWWIFFPLVPLECEQAGGYWNFTIGACYPEPQTTPVRTVSRMTIAVMATSAIMVCAVRLSLCAYGSVHLTPFVSTGCVPTVLRYLLTWTAMVFA